MGAAPSHGPEAPNNGISRAWHELHSVSSLERYYELGDTIGRGEFAKVKVARCLNTDRIVAIKIVRMPVEEQSLKRVDRLLREISILSVLHSHSYLFRD